MAIEIDVADQIGMSALAGVLRGTVIVRFDGPIETMKIAVLHSRGEQRLCGASAKQLAFRLTQERI